MTSLRTDAAYGRGLATRTPDGTILDAWFPVLGLGQAPADAASQFDFASACTVDQLRNVEVYEVACDIASLADPIADAVDAYLRLHLLSNRFVQPRTINLDGIFGILNNVAWTTAG
ncbi:MAG: 2,3,4,5-tetrahydropyridine-2,6-dicarboxylate N-succinyltransferase, partial [Acidimicrobiales bacterium]|nr:2,3,4,5-tetrahydropyridine-2,6-dicarboxylate N-succinyltransferase [Acidimicrobiales bacterium]